MNRQFIATSIIGAVVSVMALSGCSSDKPPQDEFANSTTCFTQLADQDRASMNEYIAGNGDEVQSVTSNGDGTNSVCVLEDDGNGGYREHYYDRDDNFNDYLLYSMMLGHSNALTTYGLISGDLSFSEAMALQMLAGVNSGGIYRPYNYTDRGWGYQPQRMQNTRITNVYYGSDPKPVSYSDSISKPRPGYSIKPLPSTKPDAMASARIDANGKPVVNKTADRGATQTLADAKVITPPSSRRVAPVQNVPLPPVAAKPPATPAPAVTSQAPKATTQAPAPKPSTASKPAPTQSKPKPQTQAPAPKPKPAPAKPKPAPSKPHR